MSVNLCWTVRRKIIWDGTPGASNTPPVNSQLLISRFGGKAAIAALARGLSFAPGAASHPAGQQEGSPGSGAGSALPAVGLAPWKLHPGVSGLLGNGGGCEAELPEERGRFSGKYIFALMKNFRWAPWRQRKAVNEMQSSSLPRLSQRSPCQDPALASRANTVSTQIFFVPQKKRFWEASLVPRSWGEEGRRGTVSHGNCRGHSVITRGPG